MLHSLSLAEDPSFPTCTQLDYEKSSSMIDLIVIILLYCCVEENMICIVGDPLEGYYTDRFG